MGFLPSSSTIQLYAYFTDYAREMIFNGDVINFQAASFSLHDEDINYQISKEIIGVDSSGYSIYNTLKSGFLPDYTGDNDICVKSNKSMIVLGKNTLKGTTTIVIPPTPSPPTPPTPPPPSSRVLKIGFENATSPIEDYSSPPNRKNFSYTINIILNQNIGEPNPTLSEISNTSFTIELVEPPLGDAILASSIQVANKPLPATINFSTSSNLQVVLSFSRDVSFNPEPSEVEPAQIKLRLVSTNPNREIDTTKQLFIYRANIYTD